MAEGLEVSLLILHPNIWNSGLILKSLVSRVKVDGILTWSLIKFDFGLNDM